MSEGRTILAESGAVDSLVMVSGKGLVTARAFFGLPHQERGIGWSAVPAVFAELL